MKKNLSLAGFSLVAMGLFMGSCVSKRKYMDAQTSAAQRYSTDSAQWASRTSTMQQNISSLEQRSSDYQKQMDSFRTASTNYQKRWDNLQSTYTQQNTSTEQLHQQIHTAIDQYVEASNVESRNGRIYVNLPEKMLFTSGSSTLSAKGKQALDKLADVLAANQNVEVDIIASAAYYNGGTGTTGTSGTTSGTGNDNTSANNATDATTSSAGTTGRNNNATTSGRNNNANRDAAKSDTSSTARSNNAQAGDTSGNPSATSSTAGRNNQSANVGDSAYPGSGSRTAKTSKQDPNKKQSTAKSRTATTSAKSSTARTSTAKQGDRSVSFSSTPKSGSKSKSTASTAPSWNLNVARSTSIVRELTQNGLPQARILLTGQNSKGITTNEWASTNRGYQIVVSPKMDSYYQMMQEGQQGQGTTSKK